MTYNRVHDSQNSQIHSSQFVNGFSTNSILNVEVSCFANFNTPTSPKTVNLLQWLRSAKYASEVGMIRSLPSKEERDVLKAKLPAIMPSGLFSYRAANQLIAHSGFLQFDIDGKDHTHVGNFDELKSMIANINVVAYCGVSVSGFGLWGLVKIAHPDKHSEHFDALYRKFNDYAIELDTKPRSVASLRGYSYDQAPYFNHQAGLFRIYDESPRQQAAAFQYSNGTGDIEKVEVCIAEIIRRRVDITGDYGQWRDLGASLFQAFGEQGRDYFHQISQFYPNYSAQTTDRQFYAGRTLSRFGLGTFFKCCDEYGIYWKELLPLPERPASIHKPTSVHTIDDQLANPGSILKPDESQIERLTVEPTDSYPVEWDKPNPPDAKPAISAKSFFEWQQKHKYFSQMGLNSLSQ